MVAEVTHHPCIVWRSGFSGNVVRRNWRGVARAVEKWRDDSEMKGRSEEASGGKVGHFIESPEWLTLRRAVTNDIPIDKP
jgi:hypothetical protein